MIGCPRCGAKKGGHYSVNWAKEDEAWGVLRSVFKDPVDFSMNWLFLSTSGVHGSYASLSDLDEMRREALLEGDSSPPQITFLIVKPRLCQLVYGTVGVSTDAEERWLREVVTKTLKAVTASQTGNVLWRTDEHGSDA